MSDLSFHELQHIQKMLQQQGSIKYIFDDFTRAIGMHMSKWTDTGTKNIWIKNAAVEKAIEKEISLLHDKLVLNIENYTSNAWNRSNLKSDELVSAFIKNLPINKVVKDGLFARNEEVLKTFLKRKVDNLTLSDRVWKLTGTAKENIEYYLQSGLSTGRPAVKISQDVRQLLKEPDRRFRRIRNAEGKLIMSQPMADYHPGQGVYRSSFKNARRLAVTNTNEMYRISDYDRWQNIDFILGIDVKRSASKRDDCPVCDSMEGRYPKDFLFKGWHPQCICYATPLLMDEDNFIDALVEDDFSDVKYIEDLQSGPRNYLNQQFEKGNLSPDSYLLKENKKFFTK